MKKPHPAIPKGIRGSKYGCEEPERPGFKGRRFWLECQACMIAFEAALLHEPDTNVSTVKDGRPLVLPAREMAEVVAQRIEDRKACENGVLPRE